MTRTRAGNLDELVVYSAFQVTERGEPCTFERIVVEAFRTFPEEFALAGFDEYPDSARVNKCWLRCRTDRGWLVGNVKHGFSLSETGRNVALEVRQRLQTSGGARPIRSASKARNRESAILRHLLRTKAFRRFRENSELFQVTEKDLREVTLSTMDTPVTTLRQNLNQLRNEAKVDAPPEVMDFLEQCMRMARQMRGGG